MSRWWRSPATAGAGLAGPGRSPPPGPRAGRTASTGTRPRLAPRPRRRRRSARRRELSPPRPRGSPPDPWPGDGDESGGSRPGHRGLPEDSAGPCSRSGQLARWRRTRAGRLALPGDRSLPPPQSRGPSAPARGRPPSGDLVASGVPADLLATGTLAAGRQSFQLGLHEGVEIAVENRCSVARFVVRPEVLDHLVGMEDIAP